MAWLLYKQAGKDLKRLFNKSDPKGFCRKPERLFAENSRPNSIFVSKENL
jgi:hypothetical protein